jgi:hypothetical protein
VAERRGYTSPADMIEKYPAFFWKNVEPYIGDALGYLGLGPHVGARAGERP